MNMTTTTVAVVSLHLPCHRLSSNISYGYNNKSRRVVIKKHNAVGSVITSFYTETLYQVLGISESISGTSLSSSDIKKAYKEMARKYHPDVSPPERVDEYTRKFILVREAYETLSDPRSRALYDRDLSSSNFNFSSSSSSRRYPQDEDESVWRMRWQSQLDGLKRRDVERQTS